ncbi:MAG: DUF4345 family protein [Planctomycetota bacterium]
MLFIIATFFLLMGIAGLATPGAVARQYQVDHLTVTGRNEVRAVYGGFGIAIAFVLVYANYDTSVREGVVITVAIALAGMAAGRVVSAVIDRGIGRFALVFTAVECLLRLALLTTRSP